MLERLLVDAEAAGRVEICGLLLASGAVIVEAVPVPNVAPDRGRGFALEPGAHLAAARAARASGRSVVGHYHSHPSGDPRPSPADAVAAGEEGVQWLIIAAGEAAVWISREGGSVLGKFESMLLDPV